MKNNYDINTLIAKFLSSEISAEERIFLLSWINEKDENRKNFDQLRNIWHASYPAFDPNEIDVAKAEELLNEQLFRKSWLQSNAIVWWQRIAAILLLPVLTMMSILYFNSSDKNEAIAYQEISSPMGAKSKITLPDGTTVWLNSGSQLKYPVVFEGKIRKVTLNGEAYFEVKSDKSHPFIVETNHLNITATGTQFNVESYLQDTLTSVTLVEGVVSVEIDKQTIHTLSPNQRLEFSSKSKRVSLISTEDAKHWGLWKDGILAFRDEPLGEVFKRIGRTFNVDIQVKDSAVAKQFYRATFEGESFEEILNLMQLSAPIKYKRIKRQVQADNQYNKEHIEVASR